VLRGFTNIELHPGQTQNITMTISRHDVSLWDSVEHGWIKAPCGVNVSIGSSSHKLHLSAPLLIEMCHTGHPSAWPLNLWLGFGLGLMGLYLVVGSLTHIMAPASPAHYVRVAQ
jgi:hypothetical protein